MRSIERSMIVTFAPQPERDDGGVVADHASADDDDLAGRDSGHSAEQEAAAAERLLEEVGAGLRSEPAGDLAHRCEQRQRSVARLDGLVRDRGDPALDERVRQPLVRREVQVGEEDEPVAQPAVLGVDRLLDLEQELGVAPDVVDGRDLRRRPPRTRRRGMRCPRPRPARRGRRGPRPQAHARRRASARRGIRRT